MTTHNVDPTKCSAYGCPCPGTTRSSTNGGTSWVCAHHKGSDGGSWQAITAELNRLKWLLTVCHGIRMNYGIEKWDLVYRAIQRDINVNQRSDLLFNVNVDTNVAAWLRRLESEISRAINVHRQAELIVSPSQPPDPMKRLHLTMPAHA